jgi:hypothetical protein
MTRFIFCRPQDGVQETGVSVAFTVRAMDAGPVLAQERVAVDLDVQAPELLRDLFERGTMCEIDVNRDSGKLLCSSSLWSMTGLNGAYSDISDHHRGGQH